MDCIGCHVTYLCLHVLFIMPYLNPPCRAQCSTNFACCGGDSVSFNQLGLCLDLLMDIMINPEQYSVV